MTDIDVPDWVVEAANDVLADHARDGDGVAHEPLKAALRAALSAWVVPTAKIGTCAEVKWLQGGPCQLPPKKILYTLRQEKPE